MPDLVHRTEQELLGALIYDPSLVNDVPYLLPRHFQHSDHQAIFAAFLDIYANEPGIWGATMAERINLQIGQSSIDQTRLTGLVLSSPDLASVAVYGRMIQEAALRRELLSHADRLTQAAGTVRGIDPELDHFALLSDALRSNAVHFDTSLTYELAVQAPRQDLRTLREEALLADLIQHPEYLHEVAAWLDPEVFTSPDRRSIYEAIIAVDHYGEPVQELTLSWELARARSADLTLAGEPIDSRFDATPAAPGYLARLAVTAVEAGVSIELGRDLLADHSRAELAAGAARITVNAVNAVTIAHQPAAHRTLRHERGFAQDHSAPLLTPPDQTLGLDGPELRQ
ncbi:DnaB-like helicase N-terminal domain-containing protein [Sphaerisporangium sp. NPDC051017]|uniref:DnaB-like helicase N-terminal domain-containing protein n=1 Tax=Sphaerisporangium sp. NPDC051017 TaxID=3154636 RepID=UPI003444EE8B